ncbi:MAG TPA: hypothetical protein VFQ20_12315 [Burkholderiaceae bacterium]|nr:hypothetical protein [Burkholderiaceae bacterium]
MNRCLVVLAVALCAALPAHAQRVFERNALRGELQLTAPPEALLNGKPARLSPGARIRNPQNMIVLSGTVVGQKLPVNYTLDGFGLVHNVWILSADEVARQPWPKTAAEATTWTFDSTLQRWSKP